MSESETKHFIGALAISRRNASTHLSGQGKPIRSRMMDRIMARSRILGLIPTWEFETGLRSPDGIFGKRKKRGSAFFNLANRENSEQIGRSGRVRNVLNHVLALRQADLKAGGSVG